MRWILAALAVLCLGGVTTAILLVPSDVDHAQATPREVVLPLSDPAGQGALDGLRFDTVMGLQGKPPEFKDYVQFSDGLFMSRECEDRCNYPPSAYLTREVDGGTAFIVEAYCPTKSTTMVWRGAVRGDSVQGTVTWTSKRWYWDTEQVLEFRGNLSESPAEILTAG
ncbi:hypothetical protein [Marivita hallyeonensis]|uniref:Uncharacterized protein n=1 Tax=Marivita hallyeonensis TaxID=996342 RepID=A0A1M5NBP7_9RHOB|nr:hypothetical protein [Marivita hallyeonensis]SHG86599.1 hypothetical protein SAMN05443551_0838 [Marivita hallyeonensis]